MSNLPIHVTDNKARSLLKSRSCWPHPESGEKSDSRELPLHYLRMRKLPPQHSQRRVVPGEQEVEDDAL
jgi:hypothetical protein